MNSKAGLLALCLLALVVVSASHKPTKPPKCSPIGDFAVCSPYVKEGYGKWMPPAYWSPCCELIRKESPDCICKAATYKHNDYVVDLSKAMALPKACLKKEEKGTNYWCAPKPKYASEKFPSPPYHHHKSPPPPKKSHPPPYHHKSPPPPKKSHPPPYHHHKSPPPPKKFPPPPYHHKSPPPREKSPPPYHHHKSPPPPKKYPPPPYHHKSPPPPEKSPPPPYHHHSPPPPKKSPPPPYHHHFPPPPYH